MKLYYAPGACSVGIHVLLEEIGKPYEAVPLNIREGAQFKPEVTSINPKSKVPTLVKDSGETLTVTYQVVNVGDTDTSAEIDPSTGTLLSLVASIDGGVGTFTPGTPTSNNPNVTCSQFNFFGFSINTCKGHLAPGEGVTITFTMDSVSGSTILLEGKADPNGDATEFIESNNNVTQTVKINP